LIKKLNGYKKEIRDNFSFTDPIDLNWLTNASWIFLILTLISLTTFLLSNFKVLPIDAQPVSLLLVLHGLVIFTSASRIRQSSVAEYYGQQIDPVKEQACPRPLIQEKSIRPLRSHKWSKKQSMACY